MTIVIVFAYQHIIIIKGINLNYCDSKHKLDNKHKTSTHAQYLVCLNLKYVSDYADRGGFNIPHN